MWSRLRINYWLELRSTAYFRINYIFVVFFVWTMNLPFTWESVLITHIDNKLRRLFHVAYIPVFLAETFQISVAPFHILLFFVRTESVQKNSLTASIPHSFSNHSVAWRKKHRLRVCKRLFSSPLPIKIRK